MVKIDSVKLATGAEFPLLGLGTWLATDHDQLEKALRVALDVGYRYIDTAYVYGNESVIGKVVNEYITNGKFKREDIFITSKLPLMAHAPNDAEKIIDIQLKSLQTDYIDLYLIHCPCPCKHEKDSFKVLIEDGALVPADIDLLITWKVLEKYHCEGKFKAIGLSNFNEEQIQRIIDHAEVKPHNLQVETHIYWPQFDLFEFCKKNNITFTSYGPLGSPGRKAFQGAANWPDGEPLKDPLVLELAKKHGKTPAQILIRHMVQRGISTIPKSVNPERVQENFNIFDFKLSDDEVDELNNIKQRTRLFLFEFVANHSCYPFKDVDRSALKKLPITEF